MSPDPTNPPDRPDPPDLTDPPARLALFPLGTLLCPGAQLRLQVFEPRYVRLVEDLTRSGGPPEFGVVAIRAGHEVGVGAVRSLYDVGCVAQLDHLEPGHPSSGIAYRLRAHGTRRFRLAGIDATAASPYLTGLVQPLAEDDGAPTPWIASAAADLREALAAYRDLLGAPLQLPLDPARLGYVVADTVALELADRQRLLSAPTTLDRLRIGRVMVRREVELVRRLHAVPRAFQPGPSAPN